MKKEDISILKGKMSHQVSYKKQKALLNDSGKKNIVEIINEGAICELREKQILDNRAQTITIKIYFKPTES
ncbi:MAG: hypothetical protein K9J37_19690 [Saprospiraceae bacterium]|nr:hypothetical protein [Saprospiraceae bacterium]MCF8252149.1 hypothetical protein [Saprospiraceae bacterium]MCF8282442.1 hypothetical protein [Bacteroidales bacterium]MCF8313818.1 hypothetical protein [Saprospiraceae bacterium]MCF8442524.1 hypothetical protein [Saprospiraceae bacterium]